MRDVVTMKCAEVGVRDFVVDVRFSLAWSEFERMPLGVVGVCRPFAGSFRLGDDLVEKLFNTLPADGFPGDLALFADSTSQCFNEAK